MRKASKYKFTSRWNILQLSLLIFPLLPALGGIGLFLILVLSWKQQFQEIISDRLNWGWGLLSIGLILISCFSFKPSEALLGLGNFLPFFALFAAITPLIETPTQLRRIAWILVIPSLPIVILGLGQLFLGWTIPDVLSEIVGWSLRPFGNPPGRMASVFMYANTLAAYLLIVFVLGVGLGIETYQNWRQGKPKQGRVLGLMSTIVTLDAIALILTHSRNAWGILFLSVLAFALYLGWRWLVLALCSATTAILWASFGNLPGQNTLRQIVPAYFWARLSDKLYTDRPIPTLRITQWNFALEMTQQRPLLGWGLRNFTPLYEEQMGVWLGHPHNLFLMLTAETGIPATVLFCVMVGAAIAPAILLLYSSNIGQSDQLILFTFILAFAGCVLFNLFDVTLFDLRVNALGWVLLACIYGVGKKGGELFVAESL